MKLGLLVVALFVSACANTAVVDDSVAAATTADSSSEPANTGPAAEPEILLVSGRDALAAVEGEPHVIWFWGAH